MDDIRRLAQAVLVDGEMARPASYDNLVPVGPWRTAKIVDASIYVCHDSGLYFGTVRFVPERTKTETRDCHQQTFHELWMQGWTSVEFMEAAKAAQAKEAKKARKRPLTPWTIPQLVQWAAAGVKSRDAKRVCQSLTVESLPDRDTPWLAKEAVRAFRRMSQRDRLARVIRILREDACLRLPFEDKS